MSDFSETKQTDTCMLRQGGVVQPILGTLLLPVAEDGPPLPLHRSEDGDVQRLEDVCEFSGRKQKRMLCLAHSSVTKGDMCAARLSPIRTLMSSGGRLDT